jgi:hypothetical protein
MKVGSTAGVISGLSPGTEKDGEDGTTDIIIIIIITATGKFGEM